MPQASAVSCTWAAKDDGAIAKGQWKQLSEHPGDSDDGAAISNEGG
ncbi:MAG: hypothetical protein ACLR0U_10115 [Enterocloster clostridioformis]